MPQTFFILAGEASGDQHAAALCGALKRLDPSLRIMGMGGERMKAAGVEIVKDLEGMTVLGFWEVARKYDFFKQVFYKLLDRVKQERPAALICVDYPGFNLRFAREVRKLGIPVLYYIVPQVWAWKPLRAKKMAQCVDRCFCFFDFEPPFFEKFGVKAEFVGHPLMERNGTAGVSPNSDGRKIVSLLPGSRSNEFNAHWWPMCRGFALANQRLGNLQALLSIPRGIQPKCDLDSVTAVLSGRLDFEPRGPAISPTLSAPMILSFPSLAESAVAPLNAGPHAAALTRAADFSVVKSGTSTLEAGLSGNPMCVMYRGSPASFAIARLLVDIPVFSLVNIVLGRYAVPELVQNEANPERLADEIERGLADDDYREAQQRALAELSKKLGGPGASERAARGMLNYLSGKK